MPMKSPPSSPGRADNSSPCQKDPRIYRYREGEDKIEGASMPSSYAETKTNPDIDVDMKSANVKSKSINDPMEWNMNQVEDYFIDCGFKDEVAYVKTAGTHDEKLAKINNGPVPPLANFSLQMGVRVLELIKVLRKLAETPAPAPASDSGNGNQNGSSWADFGSSSGGWSSGGGGGGNDTGGRSFGGGNSSFDFGSSTGGRGGRGGGGGGGGRACFKCNETGHFARECPTGGGSSRGGRGGGGGGGGSRSCFKCNETGHFSRECPNGGGGGGGRGGGGDGGGRYYNNRDSSGGGESSFSSWGGNYSNNDRYGEPSAKRPRQSGDWNSGGGHSNQSYSAPAPAEESWD